MELSLEPFHEKVKIENRVATFTEFRRGLGTGEKGIDRDLFPEILKHLRSFGHSDIPSGSDSE